MQDSILQVYLQNFLKFDWLIFILGGLNFYMLFQSLKRAANIETLLYPKGYLAGGWDNYHAMKAHYEQVMDLKGEEALIDHRRKMNFYYAVFENVTGIFPLMGLLGTVLSLIPMVKSVDTIEHGLFFSALTSTFWGIVFAILSKGLNGYAQAQIEEAEKNIEVFLERYSTMVRKKNEA